METETLSIATDGALTPADGKNFFYLHNQYERKTMKIKSLFVQNNHASTTGVILFQKLVQEETLDTPSDVLVHDLKGNKLYSDFKIIAQQGDDLAAAVSWNAEDLFQISLKAGEEREINIEDINLPYNRGITIQKVSGTSVTPSVRCIVELTDID